jgi:ribonucleoside-diphosphate reductase alpha chain
MVVLDVDHPDIEEFIETKAREEEKIRVLRDAGFDMDLGGARTSSSVQYQNANNSVRVSDEFMRAVDSGGEFGLKARTDGSVIETVDARELFRKIAKAAWECADPGIQYDDTINDWHTNPETGRITASNPCSEYMSLGQLVVQPRVAEPAEVPRTTAPSTWTFVKAVELIITAMDISICFADFPTEAIGETTRLPPARHRVRQPRRVADGVRACPTTPMGPGLAACDHLADDGRRLPPQRRDGRGRGCLQRFRSQREAHVRVMRKHRRPTDNIRSVATFDREVRPRCSGVGSCLQIGEKNGWRNAQASVLAPTGTIGFMMDCDTTGIEPDFSLVKFKKLVGGGSMQIVNQTVPRALTKLGLQPRRRSKRSSSTSRTMATSSMRRV